MKRFILKTKEIRSNAVDCVAHLPGVPLYEVIIQPYVEDKTAEQRGFWHVLLKLISDETGYTPEEVKEFVKQEVLGTTVVTLAGKEKEVTSSSEKLKKDEYSVLIEHTYRIGAEAGIVLPNPRYQS